MEERRRPILSSERGAVQDSTDGDYHGVIISFNATILGWAIGAGAFDTILMVTLHRSDKLLAVCEFSALVTTDEPPFFTTHNPKETGHLVNWGIF